MLDELQEIDTSAIESLRTIKHDQEVIKEWLSKTEARKGSVSDAVYSRVRADYEERDKALEEQARPLKDRARVEYAKLRRRAEGFEQAVEAARLDKEELEFRHAIGEFEGVDYDARLRECEQRLSQRQAELAEASQLKQRFVEAFHSEDDLALPPTRPEPPKRPAAPATPPTPSDGGATSVAAGGAAAGTVVAGAAAGTAVGGAGTAPGAAMPPAANADATIMIRKPCLVDEDTGGLPVRFPLEPQLTTIGRAPDSKVRVQKDAVSRRHAQIVLRPDGYAIVDLGSENGTYVNGKRVTERLLADGDLIQIGTQKLVFREA